MRSLTVALILLPNLAVAGVTNPSVFIGEYIFGATNGAPLTVTSGAVAQGISNQEVNSTTASTCTTTAATLNGMTATPVAGTYLALFSADFSSANAGVVVTLQFDLAGTLVTASQRKFMPFAGGTLTSGSQRVTASLNSIITVNGSQAITVNCQVSANTVSTASMAMDLVRLQ